MKKTLQQFIISTLSMSTNMLLKRFLVFFFCVVFVNNMNAQVLLEANEPGNTYELINSIFAPNGGDVVESAECVHPEFGRHIAEVWDADLNQYVFEFYIHVTPDNDRCINFDRQRVEIKTYDASPDYLKGVAGETVVYKWRFKVPTGFQPSSSFTHIHQVKAVDGDAADPIFVLTARKGSPNKMELNYYSDSDLSSERLAEVNLSLFENTWVEAIEQIKLDDVNGTYSISIKKLSDGTPLLEYSNNKMLTIRSDNLFVRPKWGIYRSLNWPDDLRDETLRFNSFSISEELFSTVRNPISVGNRFLIMPNIVHDFMTIEYTLVEDTNLSIDVFAVNGILKRKLMANLKKEAGVRTETFDMSNFVPGIYFAKIQSGNNIHIAKLVVQ